MKLLFTSVFLVMCTLFSGQTQAQSCTETIAANDMRVGWAALCHVTTGTGNSASGAGALQNLTTGLNNTANGAVSQNKNITGSNNTSVGYASLLNTVSHNNTATGHQTLFNNSTGSENTANGTLSQYSNVEGSNNTSVGFSALKANIGENNTAIGSQALLNNTIGGKNTANGHLALKTLTEGNYNIAVGAEALTNNSTGSTNTALGARAGLNNSVGSGNLFIGYEAGRDETGNDMLYIANTSGTPLIYGHFGRKALGFGTTELTVDDAIKVWNGASLTTGGVWTNGSSRASKEKIRSLNLEDANSALDKLQPVRFNYKNSPDEEYVGFVSEDVPDLVAMNNRKGLSAMDVVAVLTRVVQEQKLQLSQLKAQVANIKQDFAQ